MSEHPIFVIIATLILGYGLFSKLAEKSIITPPMVFVFTGFLASFFFFDMSKVGLHARAGFSRFGTNDFGYSSNCSA